MTYGSTKQVIDVTLHGFSPEIDLTIKTGEDIVFEERKATVALHQFKAEKVVDPESRVYANMRS